MNGLGWLVISQPDVMAALRRAHAGEDPELLWIEIFANSDTEHIEGDNA